MGNLKLVDLSHPFGDKCPLWPYFEDVKIERMHYMAKSGVLSQKVTTVMHCTTHADSPGHVIEGAAYTHEIPLDRYYGTGVIVDIPKKEWEVIMPEDLEKAKPEIKKDDIVIIHTGWNKYWGDSRKYFAYSPGLSREAGEWLVEKKVKAVAGTWPVCDHSLSFIPLEKNMPWLLNDYINENGQPPGEEFSGGFEACLTMLLKSGISCIQNAGGDIDEVTGTRCIMAAWPFRMEETDAALVRLVAIAED